VPPSPEEQHAAKCSSDDAHFLYGQDEQRAPSEGPAANPPAGSLGLPDEGSRDAEADGKIFGDVRCWLKIRPLGVSAWSAGTLGHCAVHYHSTPWGALHGARRLHRLQRGSRRSAGAPDITTTMEAVTGPSRVIIVTDETGERRRRGGQ